MACEIESEIKSLLIFTIDSVIRGYHVYKDELATLEKCCNVDIHVMHTTIAILWPLSQTAKQKFPLF